MTNKGGDSKQHGYHLIGPRSPKSAFHKRRNKEKAAQKREVLRGKGLAC